LIYFHNEDSAFVPKNKGLLRDWIKSAIREEGRVPGELNFIICSDNYLNRINQEYLEHEELTDIITFDYCSGNTVTGDIFISYERIAENAGLFKVLPEHEFHRVVIHGVMHLCGYKDKKPSDKKMMTDMENKYLGKRPVKLV
jgi:probable rRNA maturation factor